MLQLDCDQLKAIVKTLAETGDMELARALQSEYDIDCAHCRYFYHIDDDPSAHCSECIQADELGVDIMAGFEPNRGCLLWEPEGRLIARGQHGDK